MCYVSHVMCHMSDVTCHNYLILFIFFLFFGQSGEAYRWRVCYQQGLPRLVYNIKGISFYVLFWTIPILKSAQNTPKESISTVQNNYFKVPKIPNFLYFFVLHFLTFVVLSYHFPINFKNLFKNKILSNIFGVNLFYSDFGNFLKP